MCEYGYKPVIVNEREPEPKLPVGKVGVRLALDLSVYTIIQNRARKRGVSVEDWIKDRLREYIAPSINL